MADQQTINVYDDSIESYAKLVDALPDIEGLTRFMASLHKGAKVLDFGCGTGAFAAKMRADGLEPVCLDASPEMVETARRKYGLTAILAGFEDLDEADVYDGIWANFSLLHAPKADFPRHLQAIHKALKSSGCFYIALKCGTGEARDKLGRFYAYYEPDELRQRLDEAGFDIADTHVGAGKGLAGSVDEWIGMLCHKR